jgi:branched-subunit amino acid ABC-type transport system permease component
MNWAQLLLNSAITGSLYFLLTLGLTMTYDLLNFANVSHAELITFGAYIGYVVSDTLNLGFIWGVTASFFSSGLLGIISYMLVFRPLARRGADFIHLCIASVGYSLTLRFLMQQAWGQDIVLFESRFKAFTLGPIRLSWLGVSIMAMAIALFVSLHLILTRTKLGKAMRATSNNIVLAKASGINTEQVLLVVWFLGSALAGIGGVLKGCDTMVIPVLGWNLLIMVFATAILGGIGSFYGAFAAAYSIGLAENLSVATLGHLGLSTDYKGIVAFGILTAMLILKPTGLSGIKVFRRTLLRSDRN